MMDRRSLLKMMGMSAFVKPTPETMKDLSLKTLGGIPVIGGGSGPSGSSDGNKEWAIKKLARMRVMSVFKHKEKERDFYIHNLDHDTASLRSMSLGAKIRRSQKIQYKKHVVSEMSWLERFIEGEEDD